MSYSLGSATIVAGQKGTFTTVNSGIQGIVIGNQSGFALSVQLEGGATAKTLYPGTADFFPWFIGFSGVIFWVPTSSVNVQNIPGSSITFDAIGKIENFNSNAYPMSIAVVQAVNPTATGNPIFTATWEVRSTAGVNQNLAVYNPANSGVIFTFHSAKVLTNDTTLPTSNMIYWNASPNLPNAVNPVTHSGWNPVTNSGAATSVSVCTADDDATSFFFANRATDISDIPQNFIVEQLAFPDIVTLNPGVALILTLYSGTTGHTIRLTLKWSENTIVQPLFIVGSKGVASNIINDGNPVGTQIIESTPGGAPQALSIFNDGSGVWAVDQSGVAHQVFKFNTAGNPLQIGKAGDVTEFLDTATIDQILNVTGASNLTGLLTAVAATFTGQMQPNQAGTTINGSTSGTITFFTPIWGSGLKIFVVSLVNFNDNSARTYIFPSSFTNVFYFSGNIASTTWQFFNGGSGLTARHMLTLGIANTSGTDEPVTAIKSIWIGQQAGPGDRITVSNNSVAVGSSVLIGIGV